MSYSRAHETRAATRAALHRAPGQHAAASSSHVRVCLLKVQRNGQRRACQDGGDAHGRCRLVHQRARRLRAGSHVRRPVRVSASASSFKTRSCSAVFWACALRAVPHCGDEVVGRAAPRGEVCEKGPESDSLRQGGAQLCPTRQTRGRHPVCRRARDAVGVSRARSVAAQRQLTAWNSAAKQHRACWWVVFAPGNLDPRRAATIRDCPLAAARLSHTGPSYACLHRVPTVPR